MAGPNIVSTTSIVAKTDAAVVGTTTVTLTENAFYTNSVLKVNSVIVSVAPGFTGTIDVGVQLYRDFDQIAFSLANPLAVSPGMGVAVISKDKSVYLEEGDAIRVVASVEGSVHAICSYECIE